MFEGFKVLRGRKPPYELGLRTPSKILSPRGRGKLKPDFQQLFGLNSASMQFNLQFYDENDIQHIFKSLLFVYNAILYKVSKFLPVVNLMKLFVLSCWFLGRERNPAKQHKYIIKIIKVIYYRTVFLLNINDKSYPLYKN